ncbi:MAG: alpha-mannosidase [Bacteroidetes bacterium]|nr:alpha-mannosidase [Bacteroidota bacterium]
MEKHIGIIQRLAAITRNILCVTLFHFFLPVNLSAQLSQHVNPFIGTGGHGHTFPGAVLPFGMVQLSPDTRIDGSWDGCSGYHYSDNTIYGFSHTHLSGTGVSDWGDVMLMPMTTKPSVDNKKYSSKFSHDKEKATAGFYEVFLKDEKINVELTVTARAGIHRYTFPENSKGNVVLDLLHRDKLLNGDIKQTDSVTITGHRISEAWAREQHCYFAIKFSKPLKKIIYYQNKKETPHDSLKNKKADAAIFQFNTENKPLMVKVAISGVSIEGALNNLNKEAEHWDFEKYKKEAESAWNQQLQKITISESNKDKLSTFYTALYHCCIHPSLNMDADNKYRGRDNQIHIAKGFTNYSVFSLWDTYRALHPLFTIIERQRTSDFINTFLHQYKESNRLPVWELSSNETDCMIGYHSVSVIADALTKNVKGIDTSLIYDAVKAAATYSGFGIPAYIQNGYVSADDEAESVSRTLEYSYDDWCIAQIMRRLHKPEDFATFIKRAQSYKNVFDTSIYFMRPRKNGGWLSPFDPKEVNNYYTEGNSWQYSFYVPHDIRTLITLNGGTKKFEQHLDSLFLTGDQTSGRTQGDLTGLIGQYAHGNEPSHHMAYLYTFIGRPDKTQDKVDYIIKNFYKNCPDGLIGNEDCGQMSAWYIFSSLGFYPVCPADAEYIIGKPQFDRCEMNLENGTIFAISKYFNTEPAPYIKSIELNNKTSLQSFINYTEISNGGTMTFSFQALSDTVNWFGKKGSDRPHTEVTANLIITAPVISAPSKSFFAEQKVSIIASEKYKTVYTLDGNEPTKHSSLYNGPISIENNYLIKAKTYFEVDSSKTTSAYFFKKPNDWKISISSPYNKQYTAGGDDGIIDGIYGDVNWRKGDWQGYQYTDFECTVDLRRPKKINSVSINFLQDTRSWIIFPKQVAIYFSSDNKNFKLLQIIKNKINPKDYTIQLQRFVTQLKSENVRYIKIIAKNFGQLPEWHQGKGDGAFIFIDEIEIK